MVCPMENESIIVCVRDTIQQSSNGRKSFSLKLTPSKLIDSIFIEVSKEFDYNVDDITITLQALTSTERDIVSSMLSYNFHSIISLI